MESGAIESEVGSFSSFMKAPYRALKHENYFAIYDEILGEFKGRQITFVEIGVLHGGSLFMWRNFFGDAARIIGVDLSDKAREFEKFGFEIFVGDQADPSFWRKFFSEVGPVDVVLDDGGHTNRQQLVTLKSTIPNIKDGGLLIVEDTVSSYMTDFGNPSAKSFTSHSKLLIDDLHSDALPLPTPTSGLEKFIFSISYFKSIVSFRVDRVKASVPAKSIVNSGIFDEVTDMRFANVSWFTYSIALQLKFLNKAQHKLGNRSVIGGIVFRNLTKFPILFLDKLHRLSIRNQ